MSDQMITIRMLTFAQLRDKLGSEASLSFSQGVTTYDFMEKLCLENAAIEPLLRHCRLALNCEYVTEVTQLKDGDEIAVIPPVSGG